MKGDRTGRENEKTRERQTCSKGLRQDSDLREGYNLHDSCTYPMRYRGILYVFLIYIYRL